MAQRQSTLVHLSTVRRRFSSQLTTATIIDSDSLESKITSLVQYLCDGDQLISFLSCKALSTVLLASHIKEEWLQMVATIINKSSLSTHVGMYSLQLFTETLRTLRKSATTSPTILINGCCNYELCISVLSLSWKLLLQLFLRMFDERQGPLNSDDERSPPHSDDDKWTQQSLTEFLSLTLEFFRYQGNSTNSSDPVLKCLVTIVGSLTRLSAVIRSSTSILVLKKYSSILLKLFDGPFLSMEVMTSLPACLLMLASTQYLQLAWRDWNDTVSVAHTNEQGPTHDTGLMNTVMRNMVLLLLKYVLYSQKLNTMALDELEELLSSLLSRLSVSLRPDDITGWSRHARSQLLDLSSEQDDCITEILLMSCRIRNTKTLSRDADSSHHPVLSALLSIVDIHGLVLEFLASLSFDHSTLIDLLISIETPNFKTFLQEYLQTLAEEWGSVNSEDSLAVLSLVESEPQRKRKRMKGSAASSEREDRCGIIATNSHWLSREEACLDKMVECFTRLRFALQRFLSHNLLHQATDDLIKHLEIVEELHESLHQHNN